jgi:hypothetical protein
VSLEETEALWFCRRTPPAGYLLRLGGMEVKVGTRMKYMGLVLDSHWAYGVHFERLIPSTEDTANALGRLLPGIFKPGGGGCRLYAVRCGAIEAFYEAPIWAAGLKADHRSLLLV